MLKQCKLPSIIAPNPTSVNNTPERNKKPPTMVSFAVMIILLLDIMRRPRSQSCGQRSGACPTMERSKRCAMTHARILSQNRLAVRTTARAIRVASALTAAEPARSLRTPSRAKSTSCGSCFRARLKRSHVLSSPEFLLPSLAALTIVSRSLEGLGL
jgi:hypothetical protein